MNTLVAAAPVIAVKAPTLANPMRDPSDAAAACPAPFSQALSDAQGSPGHGSASAHRSRGSAGGSAVPPDGKAPPPAVATAPAPAAVPPPVVAPQPVASPPPAAAAPLPLSATTGGTPANPTAPATAALTQADVSRGTATAATLHAAPSGADAATAAGDAAVAAADAAAASAATSAAASATAAGAAASAAGEAAAALPERPAAPQAGALPVTGRLATTLQPVPAASVGIGADADAPAGGAATAASPVLPVFSLQASADRHGEDAAAARAPPASATTAGSATAGAAELAGLAAAQGAGAPAAVAPAAPQPASPQFPDQLAAHVAYVVDQSLNGATLQVSPPQLGPIELRVSIEAGHAQVWLSAHHATTVDALQQGSARLRELLTGQGFGQVSVDVSQRSFQERQGGTTAYVAARTEEPGLSSVTSGALTAAPARRTASGMLDAYA